MLLQDVIEKRYEEIRKTTNQDKNEVRVLRLIKGEFDRRKNMNVKMTDKEVVSTLEKLRGEELERVERGRAEDNTQYNIEYYSKYIPEAPTDQDIRSYIESLPEFTDIKNEIPQARLKRMGGIIKHFNGLVDGSIVKDILTGY